MQVIFQIERYKRPYTEKKSSTPLFFVSSLSTYSNLSYLLEIPYTWKYLYLKGGFV